MITPSPAEPAARATPTTTTRIVLAHLRRARGEAAVARVLAAAAVEDQAEVLLRDGSWTSQDVRLALFEAVAAELGGPRALFDAGAAALRHSVSTSVAVLLRALGSPGRVYRSTPRAIGRYSGTTSIRVLEVGRARATLVATQSHGSAASRLDCLFLQGLLSSVPELFGLPAAQVEHRTCAADGAPACLLDVTWTPHPRSWRRRGSRGGGQDLRLQLEALQSAAADLTSSRDVPTVLRRTVALSASSVLAQGYLLAVHPAHGQGPLVESLGVPDQDRDVLAARLLAGEDLGPGAVVVDIASGRRAHGRLAALYPVGQQGLPDERRLLGAYAGHAAAALDLLTALEDSRRDEERASTLLCLAHELAAAASTQEVCDLVSRALLRVVGCESASVLLWEASAGELRAAGSAGLSPEATALLFATPLRPEDTPELTRMLTAHEPLVVTAEEAQPVLRLLLDAVAVEHLVAVPLVRGGELLGVATASWGPGPAPAERSVDLTLRLRGVADQAATALENARLLGRVQHQAAHDALTGLPNRRLVLARLDAAVAAGPVSVLFCDLDRYKQVNDALGHAAGDELLRQVAARLRGAVRPADTVGRLSGDEFAVLLPGLGALEAEHLAQRLAGCFDLPFRLEGRDVRMTASIGVASADGGTASRDALLRSSDAAMYRAKQRGRGQVAVSGAGRAPGADGDACLAGELRAALEGDQLRLVFQPVLAVPERRVVSVEALVRWEHPRLGLLAPGAFLPVAEESGLVADLDLWVLQAACAALATWPGDAPARVAVNLSSAVLGDPRLLPAVREALAGHGLDASRLTVEVVESRSLVDLPVVVERLVALRRLGVGVALDDFGTGYSTLSLLQQLPATTIKIDRSFVSRLDEHDPFADGLVRGVLALAGSLGLDVVAEGVETQEQLDVLLAEGCRYVQGYLLGRPAPRPQPATAER